VFKKYALYDAMICDKMRCELRCLLPSCNFNLRD